MKNLFISILAAATMYSCGSNNFTITGNINPDAGDSVYILNTSPEREVLASAPVDAEGNYTIKGEIKSPVIATFTNGVMQPLTTVFLESGEIKISSSEENENRVIATGSPSNDNYHSLQKSLAAIEQEFYDLGGDVSPEQMQAIQDKYKQQLEETVANNIDNILGVYIFAQTVSGLEPEEAQVRMAKFSPAMQATEIMQSVKKSIDSKVNTSIGKPYINIALPDANDQEIALSSLVGHGKWVLVDFWATWCGPCMGELPHLVEAYKTFADKGFTIYGVSLDDKKEAWIKGLAANEMTWPNVIDLKQEGKDQAAEVYGISVIPSNFLISPEGVIVAKDLRGEDVMTKLQEFIK